MKVACAAVFSNQEQIHLREATIILHFHNVSNIVTLNGINTKKRVTDGFLEYIKFYYRFFTHIIQDSSSPWPAVSPFRPNISKSIFKIFTQTPY